MARPGKDRDNRIRELEARLVQGSSEMESPAVLLSLAELHAAGFGNSEGLRRAGEALNIARTRNDVLSAARALAIAARCHHQRGDYSTAVATGLDAIDVLGDADAPGRSGVLQTVARSLMAVEAFDLAEDVAHRAAADAAASGNPAVHAGACAVAGELLLKGERFEEARRHFREACAIWRKRGDTLQLKKGAALIGNGYLGDGHLALQHGDRARARLLWRQAIRVFRIVLATGTCANADALACAAISECEWQLENPVEALAAALRGIELASESRSPLCLAQCRLRGSYALKALGRLEAARRACESAREAAEQLEHERILAECLRAESKLNDLAGRFERAQDLEMRAELLSVEREAHLARIREELAVIWVRDTRPRVLPSHMNVA